MRLEPGRIAYHIDETLDMLNIFKSTALPVSFSERVHVQRGGSFAQEISGLHHPYGGMPLILLFSVHFCNP